MKGENSDRVPLLLPLSLPLLIFLPLSSPSVFTSASTRHRLLLALAYLTLLLTLPCSFTLLQNVYSELKTFKTSTGIWVIDIFYRFLYLWSVATSSHPQNTILRLSPLLMVDPDGRSHCPLTNRLEICHAWMEAVSAASWFVEARFIPRISPRRI